MRYDDLIVSRRRTRRFAAADLTLPSLVGPARVGPRLSLPGLAATEPTIQEILAELAARYPEARKQPDLWGAIVNAVSGLVNAASRIVWAIIGPLVTGGMRGAVAELRELPTELRDAAEAGVREGLKSGLVVLGEAIVDALRSDDPARAFQEGFQRASRAVLNEIGDSVGQMIRRKVEHDLPTAMVRGAVDEAVQQLFYGRSVDRIQAGTPYVSREKLRSAVLAEIDQSVGWLGRLYEELTNADLEAIRRRAIEQIVGVIDRLEPMVPMDVAATYIKSAQYLDRYAIDILADRGKLRLIHVARYWGDDYLWDLITAVTGGDDAAAEAFLDELEADRTTYSSYQEAARAFERKLAEFIRRRVSRS